jgi:hypothetical protein
MAEHRVLVIVAGVVLSVGFAVPAVGGARPADAATPAGWSGPPARTAELPEATADPDAVRAEAERILRDAPFARGEEPEVGGGGEADGGGGSSEQPPPRAELPQAPVFEGMGPIAQALMWILLVALAALAAWIVVRSVRGRRARRAEADEDDTELVEHLEDPTDRPAGDWLDLAERAEAAGAWREGLLHRYRALVVLLVDRGVLDPVPGRTVGEHRDQVASRTPDATGPFAVVARLFERAWYGDRPTGANERDAFRDAAAGVAAATATGDRGGAAPRAGDVLVGAGTGDGPAAPGAGGT